MTTSGTIELQRDAFGRLVLTVPGLDACHGVTPVRAFPLSAPWQWIAFLDEHGREVFCLDDAASLPAPARAVLEEELTCREFIPIVIQVHDISAGAEPTSWRVATDRGEVRFVLNSEDHIRRLGLDGALIVDSLGVRYRIQSLRELDAHSRRLLRRYL